MESVAEVPEEASGLRQPRFWIRVFLLLDRLPAKANETCLPTDTPDRHTDRQTHTQIALTLAVLIASDVLINNLVLKLCSVWSMS